MEKVSRDDYNKAQLIIEGFKCQQNIPQPLDEPIDYSKLREATEKYINLLRKGKITNDDFKQEIFVSAVECVFGREIWEWAEKNIKIIK